MASWIFVCVMIGAGSLMACQAPINAALSRSVGSLEAGMISITVSWVALFAATLLLGKGSLGAVRSASWWQLLGGLIGAMFVVTSLLCVQRIGMTALIVAAVAGQVAMAVLIDQFAWLGVVQRGLDVRRIAGIVLVAAGVLLVNWRAPENAAG